MALTRTWRAWSAAGGRRSKPAPSRGNQPLKPPKSSPRCLERHRRRYREFLVRLEGDFLGQHDVAHGEGEAALGHEAPAADGRKFRPDWSPTSSGRRHWERCDSPRDRRPDVDALGSARRYRPHYITLKVLQ